MGRRRKLFALGLIVVVVASAAGAFEWESSNESIKTVNSRRAVATYDAMQTTYYCGTVGLYKGTSGPYSYLWPFSQVMSATDYLAMIPGSNKLLMEKSLYSRLAGLGRYNCTETIPYAVEAGGYESAVVPPLGNGGTQYYDDNGWVTLALIEMYVITHNSTVLRLAEIDYNFILGGWYYGSGSSCSGGLFWNYGTGMRYRNVPANGPAAEAGAELYAITGNVTYLRWAERIYDWVNGHLLSKAWLYYDGIQNYPGVPCYVVRDLWTYNQGTMIGAGTLLYLVTGNSTYLQDAEHTASASLAYFSANDRLFQQPPEFNAIYFRNMAKLLEVDQNKTLYRDYLGVLQAYGNTAWKEDRTASGIFVFGVPPSQSAAVPSSVIETAAMIQIYSLLAGAEPYVPVLKNSTG